MTEEKKLVPKLRFPEFRGAREWVFEKVDVLVDTVTPPKKFPTSSYAHQGAFPIIDQSQSEICGWTDDQDALIKNDLPLIVFGDHTCILKFVHQPFAQGADGIKILKSRSNIGASYLYQYLNYRPVVTEEYKRHYSILKEKVVLFPDIKTGEQQKIADCLSSLDELIAAQARKVDALKTHKKGLMQQFFPREGETQPRLRFPEFRGVGEWVNGHLSELGEIITGKTPSIKESELWGGEILFITPTDISEDEKYQHSTVRKVAETRSTKMLPEGSIAYTCIASIGKISLTVCPSITNQQINAVVPNKKTVGEFIYYALLQLTPWIKTIPASSTLPIINKTDFSKIVITYPESKDEQRRIVDCLKALDDLITSQTQALETLKTHKKGLMQQLFPSLEEKK